MCWVLSKNLGIQEVKDIGPDLKEGWTYQKKKKKPNNNNQKTQKTKNNQKDNILWPLDLAGGMLFSNIKDLGITT